MPAGGAPEPITFCQERGVQPGTDYFVRVVDANTIQLRATAAGDPLSFAVTSFTVDSVASTMTLPAGGPALRDGTPIQVRSSARLPGGLNPLTTYYVLNPSNPTARAACPRLPAANTWC